MKNLLLLLSFSVLLFSCKEKSIKKIELNDIVLSAEGPYFDGPNSFQATLSNVLKDNSIDPNTIDKITLTAASIEMPDSLPSDLIQDFSLQLVSNSSEMQKIGFINPVPANGKEIEFKVAAEQNDLVKIFLEEKFIVLVDANFSKEHEAEIKLELKLRFDVSINN